MSLEGDPEILVGKIADTLKEANTYLSITLLRSDEPDSGMEIECHGGRCGITGSENAADRDFGFMSLMGPASNEPIDPEGRFPLYCTTDDPQVLLSICEAYITSGLLDPRFRWHVSKIGTGGPFEEIPGIEKFGEGTGSTDFAKLLQELAHIRLSQEAG